MKVLHVASECAQLVKVGGLADVVGALPKALLKGGVETAVAIPFYQKIKNRISGGELVIQFDHDFNVFSKADKSDENRFKMLRDKMDEAEASDHFWWASAKPWWSMEMIEQGSFRLMQIVKTSGVASESEISTASELYLKIVSTAFEWQRSGKIRQMASERDSNLKIPFKERTLEVGGEKEAIYRAFIDMMKDLEKKAVSRGEYEMAIFWRNC